MPYLQGSLVLEDYISSTLHHYQIMATRLEYVGIWKHDKQQNKKNKDSSQTMPINILANKLKEDSLHTNTIERTLNRMYANVIS